MLSDDEFSIPDDNVHFDVVRDLDPFVVPPTDNVVLIAPTVNIVEIVE